MKKGFDSSTSAPPEGVRPNVLRLVWNGDDLWTYRNGVYEFVPHFLVCFF